MYDEFNECLKLARVSDLKAVEDLLNRLKPLIIAQIKRYYNNRAEYEDLISQGYLVVLNCLRDFDESRGVNFLGYVKCQLMYAYLAKHKDKEHISLNTSISDEGDDEKIDQLVSEDEGPLDLLLYLETSSELHLAINTLSKRQKEVIVLFFIKRMSIPEIAEELGIAYRTVVNTKTIALEKLKLKLEEREIFTSYNFPIA